MNKAILLICLITGLFANIKLYHIDDGRFCTKEELKTYKIDSSKIIYIQDYNEEAEKWDQLDMRKLGDPYILTGQTACSFEKDKENRKELERFIKWRKLIEKGKNVEENNK